MTTQSLLSEFEELRVGSSAWLPSTPQASDSGIGLPPDGGRALTAEEGFNLLLLPPMSLEDQISELTHQLQDLQAQLAIQGQSPAPAPTPAPTPTCKLPKVATPTPFSRSQDDLDRFKAECGLYMSMRHAEFPDEHSQVLFVLSYMKGGAAGPWATQRINTLLAPGAPSIAFDDFAQELDSMFADPNRQATARQKLTSLRQGNESVDKLIQQFELHGPVSRMGDVALVDHFEQALHPRLQESIYRLCPMPVTWAEWKHEASVLNNQWWRFQATQPHTVAAKPSPFLSCPAPLFTPSATAPAAAPKPDPQPMDLDCTHFPCIEQRCSGLYFNCNQPGHIAHDCPRPRPHQVHATLQEESSLAPPWLALLERASRIISHIQREDM